MTDTGQTQISVALLLHHFAVVCPCGITYVIFMPLLFDWTHNGLGTCPWFTLVVYCLKYVWLVVFKLRCTTVPLAAHILNLGMECSWVVSVTPLPLLHKWRPFDCSSTGVRVGCLAGVDALEKPFPGIEPRFLSRPVPSLVTVCTAPSFLGAFAKKRENKY